MKDFDYLTDGIKEVYKLRQHTLYIGALKQIDGNSIEFLQMIADVQEHGRFIKPVHGKYLTIPTPLAGNHKANEFDNLFFYLTKNTKHPTLARVDNGNIRVYFLLKTIVRIPARSFMNSTMENGAWQEASNMFANGITQLFTGRITSYETVLNAVGKYIARSVKSTIRTKDSPKNKMITKLNKHNDNPLIDTGALLRSITWTVA